eukprot:TRINITY_DN63704_c0_g1_i1.p1 TRINITY_DN63704_c0_g1~~TRINITY_DN63704_c0_g1_i1.p1  ORF type:complete len:712 (+),score=146.15 TRINITY_DN63704_c0_g1_i1:61-2196(+)
MPKAGGGSSWKASSGQKKWVVKSDESEAKQASSTTNAGDATVPSTSEPSGPVYDRFSLLRYFQAEKYGGDSKAGDGKAGDDDAPALGRSLSLSERPPPKEGEEEEPAVKPSRSEQRRAERVAKKASEKSAAEEMAGTMPPADAFLQMYLSSMFAPMTQMYSAGVPGYTTVMLRNIPNRYTRDMLVEQLDKGYKGEFDFVYLPIDFNSKCNVGYAFINFRTPSAAQKFINEYHNQKSKNVLPGPTSYKVTEVSYARVQGRDANMDNLRDEKFIEKLTEKPEWQPLFYDDSGEEVPFAKLLESRGENVGRRRTRSDSSQAGVPPPPPPMSPMGASGFAMPSFPASPFGMPFGFPPMQPDASLSAVLPQATSSSMQMLKNLPTDMTRDEFAERMAERYSGLYDFLFMPCDDTLAANKGFAFVNFRQNKKAEKFAKDCNGVNAHDCIGARAKTEDEACVVVAAKLPSIDKSIGRIRDLSASGKDVYRWYPLLFGHNNEPYTYPIPPGATPKVKQKGKAKSEKGKGKGQAGGYGYPDAKGFPGGYLGYPGMPAVNPAYAAAMAQAAHAHATALATASAGQKGSGRDQVGLLDSLAAALDPSPKPLDEESRKLLRKQIEFYFSNDNLCKDLYLRSHMTTDGWTPIELVAQFPQVRKFKAAEKDIADVMADSQILDVNSEKSQMRLKDEELRTKWAKVPDDIRQTFVSKKKKTAGPKA